MFRTDREGVHEFPSIAPVECDREERAIDFRRAARVWAGPTLMQLAGWMFVLTAAVVLTVLGTVFLAMAWRGGPWR